MADIYQSLDEECRKNREGYITAVQESIHIDSVKAAPAKGAPYGKGAREALDHALAVGKRLGFKTENVENRAGYVEYGEGPEMIGVLGHLDVVPVGDGWIDPPFSATIRDGKLYGRGAMDDKGPTFAAMYGLKAIRDAVEQGAIPKPSRRIRVIFGTDEECGGSCMQAYIHSGAELPVMGFTPDAEYPLIFCEKGMSNFKVTRALSSPESNRVKSFRGGIAGNVVTPECELVIEGEISLPETPGIVVTKEENLTKITATGKSAHGSTPQLGENACVILCRALKDISISEDFDAYKNFILTYLSTDTNGTAMDICYQDEETGETTVNLGVVALDENGFSLTLDIRYPKNADAEHVLECVTACAKKCALTAERTSYVDMLYVPKDSEVVTKLMNVYRRKTGRMEEPLAIGGGTYAKAFHNMVAFGPQYKEDPETIHAPNEYAIIDRLYEAMEMMAEAMYDLAM